MILLRRVTQMRHKIAGRKLDRPTAHRMAMLKGLVCDLIEHESISTTHAKAQEVRRLAEKVITNSKNSDLSNRRKAIALLRNKSIVKKLFNEIGPRFKDRNGGYTRIYKVGQRIGDAANLSRIELV